MDPIALTTLIASATKFSWQIAITVRGATQGVRRVDEHVLAFSREIDGLRGLLNAITTTLNDPAVGLAEIEDAGEENRDMWSAIAEAVDNCHTTLKQLCDEVAPIQQEGGNRGLLNLAVRALKLHLEKDEIAQLRSHLHVHQTSLSTSLQMLQVYIGCRLPLRLQKNLDQKFDDLSQKITSLGFAIENGKPARNGEPSLSITAYSSDENRTSLMRLKKAAEKVRSEASVKSVARSSTVARTRASVYSEYASTVDPLSDGTRQEIARWNWASSPSPSTPGHDRQQSNASLEASTAVELPADGPGAAARKPTITKRETLDSDFEIDFNITQSWASKGDVFFRQRLYAKAADCYQNAKQRSTNLHSPSHMQEELQQISLRLAWSHLRTSHFDESQRTLEDLLQPRLSPKTGSYVPVFATFLLSLLMMLRGRYSEAERHCRNALKDCRAMEGRQSFWYHKMLHHLALIHMAKNEMVESTAVFNMLPLTMRPPHVDLNACAAVRNDYKNANKAPTDPCRLESLCIYLFPAMSKRTDEDARESAVLRQGNLTYEMPATKSGWSRKMADAQRRLGIRSSEGSSDGGRSASSVGKSLFGFRSRPDVSPWSPVYPLPQPDVAELPSAPPQSTRPVMELLGDLPVPVELPAPVSPPGRHPRRSADEAVSTPPPASPVSPAISAISRTPSPRRDRLSLLSREPSDAPLTPQLPQPRRPRSAVSDKPSDALSAQQRPLFRRDRPPLSRETPAASSAPQLAQLRRKPSLPLAFDSLIEQPRIYDTHGPSSASAVSGSNNPLPPALPRRESASSHHSTISRLTIGEGANSEQGRPSSNANADEPQLFEASPTLSPALHSILSVGARSETRPDTSSQADADGPKYGPPDQAQALEDARLSLMRHIQMLNE